MIGARRRRPSRRQQVAPAQAAGAVQSQLSSASLASLTTTRHDVITKEKNTEKHCRNF